MSETPPQAAPRNASHLRIILMLVCGGLVLAVGGCALFLANLNVNGGGGRGADMSAAGAIIFIAGCLALLVGLLWGLVRFVDRLFNKREEQKKAASGGS